MKKEPIQLSDHFTYGKLLRFVYPSIMMMIFTSIYGVVDGLFVSNFVGKTSFAAVNLVMPFVMLFGGIGFMLGTGGTALVAMTLGEGKRQRADEYFTIILWATLIIGIATSALGCLFMRPVCIALGADESMLDDCVIYGQIVVAFNVTFMLQNAFQSFFVTAEKPKLGLAATVAAGVTNMVLDAVFVGWLRWGVVGAAFATGLSQCVGGVLPLVYFLLPNSSLLRLTKVRWEIRPVIRAMTNGASEMVSSVTSSVVGILYNIQLLRYAGEDGVAAYGVLMYVGFIFVAVFVGYAIGSAPIVGYHFGAQNHAEMHNMLKKSTVLMFSSGTAMFVLAELLARPMAAVYVGYDQRLLEMTTGCFRISVTTYLLTGFNIFASSFFTALNNGKISAAISFLRTFVFKLSAVLLLPMVLGLNGIWWAEVTAEVASFLISLIFLAASRRRYQY